MSSSTKGAESEMTLTVLGCAHLDSVTIFQDDNVAAVAAADVILLCCKPYMVKYILAEPGMQYELGGKLLISICAGVTSEQISEYLYGQAGDGVNRCTIVRAMPNTASQIQESMTVIATSDPPLPDETSSLLY
ncbi:pyrroline-5-carboxylate reductase protein [Rutstroemia sp. NJR-2017a WRK4]|nr:pyrroline-5-carboxylate reductase protein [Rutstroemia sp. NJR-2017a WRK4]